MGTSQNRQLFEDYEEFVDKFKPKKTTDDCYTPQAVYNVVLDFVRSEFNIDQNVQIVRPFYPGGDYENYEYPEECVVVDNPPFSIYSKIIHWYVEHEIKFFMFAPHLTCASVNEDVTFIICNAQVTYENGAVVPTSFVTNLSSESRFWCCPKLKKLLDDVNLKQTKTLPKIKFDPHAALLGIYPTNGVELKILKSECVRSNNCGNRRIFGGGYLVSDDALNRLNEAKQQQQPVNCTLNEQQKLILKQLNERQNSVIKNV